MSTTSTPWDWEIRAKTSWGGIHLGELWSYRHLLVSLVRRDFLLNYQQTVLGPLWILFQPILTLATYVLVFGKLVRVSTDSIPPVLFYFSGIVLWNFFNDAFGGTSNTFRDNAHIFSKVYFPRLIMPIAVVSTSFLRFLMQFALLFILMIYYYIFLDFSPYFTINSLLLPLTVVLTGIIGLGLGLLFSVLTAKYRDIGNLVSLGLRLLMFVTPVIYPVSSVPEKLRWIVQLNPLTPLFELFRLSMFGKGTFSPIQLLYMLAFTVVVFLGSVLLFNKQGDKLIDFV